MSEALELDGEHRWQMVCREPSCREPRMLSLASITEGLLTGILICDQLGAKVLTQEAEKRFSDLSSWHS